MLTHDDPRARAGARIAVHNPATAEVVGEVAEATPEEVAATVDAARAAFPAWTRTPAHERVAMLRRASELVAEHREELAELLCRENGKPVGQARDEIDGAVRLIRTYAEEALRLYGITVPGDSQPGMERDLILTRHEPRGVLGAIIAFNFPMDLFSHKVSPALATGNCVVIKPAEEAPLTVIRAVGLFHEAGVPQDALKVVTGYGHTAGAALAAHSGVDVVSLTGSTAAGLSVAAAAASRLSPALLELGGNDPLIVFADADLDLVVENALFGRTLAAGQVCCASKRFIVHRSLAGDLADALEARLAALRVGDGMDPGTGLGPLITEEAAARAAEQVRHTLEQGATLRLGEPAADGAFLGPVLLCDVGTDTDVAHDMEIFAPVLPLIAFDDDDEALRIANDTQFGLNASLFTRDLDRAITAAHHIQAGLVSVNATGLYRPDAIPYGGYKMSGLGREGATVSLRELTQDKTIALRGVLPGTVTAPPPVGA